MLSSLSLTDALTLIQSGEYRLHYREVDNWYLVFIGDGGPFIVYVESSRV
jgi:hypothetical protein